VCVFENTFRSVKNAGRTRQSGTVSSRHQEISEEGTVL
jgi:hypothetical protein